VGEEFLSGQPYVPGNLAQQNRGDVSSWMAWDGRAPTVHVPVLHVRTSLPDQLEAESLQKPADLSWLQNRNLSHVLIHLDGLGADELGFERGSAVFEEHA